MTIIIIVYRKLPMIWIEKVMQIETIEKLFKGIPMISKEQSASSNLPVGKKHDTLTPYDVLKLCSMKGVYLLADNTMDQNLKSNEYLIKKCSGNNIFTFVYKFSNYIPCLNMQYYSNRLNGKLKTYLIQIKI